MKIEKGEVLGILGPNGCGKSTLLKTLADILKPIVGAVLIDEKEVSGMSSSELAKKMSVMFTERGDLGFLTAFDVVALGRYPYLDHFGRLSDRDAEIIMDCLKIVNAEHLAKRFFFEMSDGEKQKILIARALAQEPEIMLLDEPTSFLDARHKIEIMLLLRRIAIEKEVSIILTTHDIEMALRICDRVVLVGNGRVVYEGIPEEVLTAENLSSVYGFNTAHFDAAIGSFEIKNANNTRLHIVCGAGTGAKLMRFLVKKGIGFTAGVLHENDIDCVIARSVAKEVVVEKPFEPISYNTFKKAVELAEGRIIVDTAFPVGEFNERNFELFEVGSKVLTFRRNLKKFRRVRCFDDVLREVMK